MTNEFKILKTFQYPIDANIAKGLLEANEIEAILFDENTVYANPVLTTAVGGVKLLVKSSDFEKAQLLFSEIDEENNNESLQILCPTCGSAEIQVKSYPNWLALLIMVFSFSVTPSTGNKTRYKCEKCNNRWSAE